MIDEPGSFMELARTVYYRLISMKPGSSTEDRDVRQIAKALEESVQAEREAIARMFERKAKNIEKCLEFLPGVQTSLSDYRNIKIKQQEFHSYAAEIRVRSGDYREHPHGRGYQ